MNVVHSLAVRCLVKQASACSGSRVVALLSRSTHEPAADFSWQQDNHILYATIYLFFVENALGEV